MVGEKTYSGAGGLELSVRTCANPHHHKRQKEGREGGGKEGGKGGRERESGTFYFLRSAAYLQRRLEAQQYKLKVERQLVSETPTVLRGFLKVSLPSDINVSKFILL